MRRPSNQGWGGQTDGRLPDIRLIWEYKYMSNRRAYYYMISLSRTALWEVYMPKLHNGSIICSRKPPTNVAISKKVFSASPSSHPHQLPNFVTLSRNSPPFFPHAASCQHTAFLQFYRSGIRYRATWRYSLHWTGWRTCEFSPFMFYNHALRNDL